MSKLAELPKKYFKLGKNAESFTDPLQEPDNRTLSRGQVKPLRMTPKVTSWMKGGGLEEASEKEYQDYQSSLQQQEQEQQQQDSDQTTTSGSTSTTTKKSSSTSSK